MPTDKSGKVVFVGNIPYGLSEEQIVHLLGQCGQVLSFRLVYDKDTGRSKGFGFAEFSDADSASSAVRNLNGYETMGRTLRVDYSNEAGSGDNAAPSSNMQSNQQQQLSQQQHFQQFQLQHQTQQQAQPSQSISAPVGVNLPDNVSAPDAISRTLSAIDPEQLLNVLRQMKDLITTDPTGVHNLLTEKPQLSYAIFQALLLMGLVDTAVLAQVVEATQPPKPQYPQSTPLPFQQQQPPNSFQQPLQPPPSFPQSYHQPMGNAIGTPPVPNQMYPPPPVPQALQKPSNLSDQQWDQIRQICSIDQPSIDAISNPVEKSSIMAIRQQYMHFFGAPSIGRPIF